MIDAQEILSILPHRFPMLLVDRVEELEPGKRIVAIKNITFNEPFFQGHFPGRPIMPGVLLVEAMAQVGGILAIRSTPEAQNKLVLFLGIEKAKFRKPVGPGDQIRFTIEVIHRRKSYWRFKGKGRVGETLVCEAELTAMITDEERNGEGG